ncbi:MAG TPA: hypothetical protein DCS67_12255 [Clostridiales bacterium UBA8960]|nr:hypothetical protein [Clostridiales bacterium UBA8960]
MGQYETLSLCGMYCGGCKNYKKNANCMGCRNEKDLLEDCPTRACCIAKGLLHCGLCDAFPCKILSDFYNDGAAHRAKAYENMVKIIEIGADGWLSEQEDD